MNPTIRPARLDDADAIRTVTAETWADRGGDYVPRVFESWVEGDGPAACTLVADVGGRAIGLLRTVLLSPDEAWCGGLRVDPDRRGEGVALRLTDAGFDWARERGASVARCMVFSWNAAGLGVARAAGFQPATEFRWVHPTPDADVDENANEDEVAVADDADAAWTYWQGSGTRDHLGGLSLDPGEPWALSSLTRKRLADAAREGRLLVLDDGRQCGFSFRVRVSERARGDGTGRTERWAEYGVADWTDEDAAAALLDAIARDAASVDADRTRVLIPETVGAVSDAAAAEIAIADGPDFVLAADLTG